MLVKIPDNRYLAKQIQKLDFNMVSLRNIAVLIALTGFLISCNQYNRILEDIYDKDQAAREWTVGMASLSAEDIEKYSYKMIHADSLNQVKVFGILDKVGWPSHLSDKANHAIFLVIDHSDLESQCKYLDLVKAKAEEGILNGSDYAVLHDRILMKQGKPQIYGTQIKMAASIVGEDVSMQLYLWPVENSAAIDSLRNSVGLSPIEDYLKNSRESIGQEIIWDRGKSVDDF